MMQNFDQLWQFIRSRLQQFIGSRNQLQQFIRSRRVRIGLALTLIASGAWALMPYLTYRVAPSAFVNAEMLRVAAPIAGRLTQDLPRKGDFFAQPVTVRLINSLSPDRRHLLDLDRELALAQEHLALAQKQLDEIATADTDLDKHVQAYRDGMIKRLNNEIAESAAEKTGCLAEAQQRQDVGSRMEKLVESGSASQIRSAEAQAVRAATLTRCEMAQARWHKLQGELASAEHGVFLQDGANDVPYSQQQRDRLLLRRQELETVALEGRTRAQQLAAQIEAEQQHIDRLAHADLTLPAAHVVWSVSASPGSTVTEGQTLVDLADCARRFVAVELADRDFEQIKPGDPAYVRLIGSSDWTKGEVQRVRGSAARSDDRLLAAQVPNPDAGKVTVEVGLPADAAAASHNNFCNIGRLAEVRFQRVRFGFLDALSGDTAKPDEPQAASISQASQ